MEIPLWKFDAVRIWVLSTRVRELLVKLCGFTFEQVGLINLDKELLARLPSDPCAGTGQRKPQNRQLRSLPMNWVYAGRLSPGKNILGLLETVHFLQRDFGLPVQLQLYGNFDDELDDSLGRFASASHREILETFLKKEDWLASPRFHGEVPQFSWLKHLDQGCLNVSFSTHMCEDFGTSAWICSSLNIPCLLSDWGGHFDRCAALIPSRMIPSTFEFDEVRRLKAFYLARLLVKGVSEGLGRSEANSPFPDSFFPDSISKKELNYVFEAFHGKYYPEILMLSRRLTNRFADTPKGKVFFQRYRNSLSGESAPKTLMIVDSALPFEEMKGLLVGLELDEFPEVVDPSRFLTSYYIERLHRYDAIISRATSASDSIDGVLKTVLGPRFEKVVRPRTASDSSGGF